MREKRKRRRETPKERARSPYRLAHSGQELGGMGGVRRMDTFTGPVNSHASGMREEWWRASL